MSWGAIIGGIVGGVIGFAVGGPAGAVYGAGVGFSVGAMIDPMTPDMPGIGDPDPDAKIMSSDIGLPISDLCGTAKITGHLLFFGKERSVAIESGYRYYMSWAVGLVSCPADPVDTLYAIYKNDDKEPVWPILETDEEEEEWEGVSLPVSGGQETIVIKNIGACTFCFGTDDQLPIDSAGELLSDPTLNTPYRRLCWAFFDNCFIGEENRTPTYRFLLKKIPKVAAMPYYAEIQGYDCNPAHALYYVFNVLSGLPLSWLDNNSFNVLAGTLAQEKRGISILFENQQGTLDYVTNINRHIDGLIRYGSDGKLHAKLIRDDYVEEDLLIVDEAVMLKEPEFNRGSWLNTVNELKIQYSELPRYEKWKPPVPSFLRNTLDHVEIVKKGIPFMRISQDYVEILRRKLNVMRVSQDYVEILRKGASPSMRVTQDNIEVIRSN